METRAIVHMDLDSFFVSVERLKNPELIGKPVIVGGSSNRGVVASCSYETRLFGVESAMPVMKARKLCPEAIVVKGYMESYSKYSSIVTEIISYNAPVYEKRSIDEFYLDLTGMEKFFGCLQWATDLRKKIIKETKLPISFGLSVNKLISKIATGVAKPNGQLYIPAGREREFIAPMSVQKIPGVGEETTRHLNRLGITLIRELRDTPVKKLEKEFGKSGRSLWERANARDDSPVESYDEQKSISTETTFHTDTTDVYFLKSVLVSLTEELAFSLRGSERLTACITVKLRYSDFRTVTQQKTISLTAGDTTLIEQAKLLFDKLYDKNQSIRLIGVRFSHLIHGHPQIHLFEDTVESIHLCQALDKIKNKYGSVAIKRATGMRE
jgi:DNA polymerase-4